MGTDICVALSPWADPRQPVSNNVVNFCEGALDDNLPLSEKWRLLADAAIEWNTATKRTQNGAGFLRRTEALRRGVNIAGAGAKLPALFTNEVFNKVYPGNLYQVRNEGDFMDDAGYVMGSDCIWISNRVRENQ
ncbi:hypothetical protein F5Y12DRAFT_716938 [Xylaria sp. FL1777]|nr:hypothetical protein F5Y12DRAFT_716938 [Xylaria sp. FL1777]